MLKALSESFRVELLAPEECTYRRMRKLEIVAFPGGVGEADEWSKIFHDAVADVRLFAQKGGVYLGICMGAYWAGPGYFDLVPGLEIQQYIRAAGSEIKRSYPTTAAVQWQGRAERMFFWDGPVFSGSVGEVVATYANGGVMALRAGRVGLIGCHPESQENWYERKYLRKFWHRGTHWELLREFAETLAA